MGTAKFDMRVLNRYFSPQAADDLNLFLEKMPQNAGKSALIAGGIAWAIAAVLGLNMFMQTKQITELRAELQKAESIKPLVPIIKGNPVSEGDLKTWVDEAKISYPGLEVNNNANTVTIQSRDTSSYSQFRESIGHVLNGGQNWKATVESFCLGRECEQAPLQATLKLDVLTIDKPVAETPK